MRVVFLDIDTQIDFMLPEGNLYVPGAEELLPLYEQISSFALEKGITVLASADAHHADDPEFSQFPAHCVKGRPGQQKVKETNPTLFFTEENDGMPAAEENFALKHVLFEKQSFDVFSNPKIDEYLESLKPDKIVVYGVATDYCVKAAVESLLERNCGVILLTDGIKAVDPAQHDAIVNDLQQKGAELCTFEEFIGRYK